MLFLNGSDKLSKLVYHVSLASPRAELEGVFNPQLAWKSRSPCHPVLHRLKWRLSSKSCLPKVIFQVLSWKLRCRRKSCNVCWEITSINARSPLLACQSGQVTIHYTSHTSLPIPRLNLPALQHPTPQYWPGAHLRVLDAIHGVLHLEVGGGRIWLRACRGYLLVSQRHGWWSFCSCQCKMAFQVVFNWLWVDI